MNMNYQVVGWTAAILFLVSIVGFTAHRVHASPHGSGNHHAVGHGFAPHKLFKMVRHLDLTREQREDIGAVMDEQRPKMRTFMLDMMEAKTALQGILNDPEYNPAAVEALAKTQAKNTEAMFISTANAFAKIGGILTPEQRRQVAERMERRRGWGKKGRHDNQAGESRGDY
ncbi:MAG: Spy/CpxP family protein refolding chaperone [Pseudomonadota bacterium]